MRSLSVERPATSALYIHRDQNVIITGTVPGIFTKEVIVANILKSVKRNPQDEVSVIMIKKTAMGWTVAGQQKGIDAKDASMVDSIEEGILDIPAYIEKGFERIL